MTPDPTDHHEDHFILSRAKKIAYGVGGMPVMLFTSGVGQVAMIFNVVFKLDALLIGMIFLFPRIWDAITDPLMGNISDNTRSKWGRRRPYILFGGLATAVLYFAMLYPPSSWSSFLTSPVKIVESASEIQGSPLDLDEGMAHFADAIDHASRGTGSANASLHTLQLTYADLSKLDAGDQLLKITTAIAGIEDPMQRTSLAANLFGSAGAALQPLLNLGADGYTALLDQARDPIETRMLVFLLIVSILFFTAFTVFIVPYFALGMEMSLDYHERSRIQGYREFFSSFGVIFAFWGLWFITRPIFPSDIIGARYFGLTLAILAGAAVIYVFRGTSEEVEIQEQDKIGFFEALKFTFSNKQFLMLAAAMLSFQLGLIVWVSLQSYINIYYVFSGDLEAGSMMVGLNASTFHIAKLLTIAPIIWLGTKIGKGKTLGIGISVSALALGLTWVAYTPLHPYWQLIMQVILIWCLPTAEIFPNAITADICDLDELKTGRRREGVFGACLASARKFGLSATPLIVGFGLSLSGFNEQLGAQPEAVLTKMRLITILFPVFFIALSGVLFLAVRIPESKIREARKILEERRKAKEIINES